MARSILAPTNEQINNYNETITERVPWKGVQRTYMAADSPKEAENVEMECPDSVLDYVSIHCPPGIPPHLLCVKPNAVYRLLCNFSIDRGLVKNTWVVPIQLRTRLITICIVRGNTDIEIPQYEDFLIPRITFEVALPSGHTLSRRQFPLAPAYATTFNSCQGIILDRIGIDLTRPVFSHGQLYTLYPAFDTANTLSSVSDLETTVRNVTFDELLL
jgi:hypothetical protein